MVRVVRERRDLNKAASIQMFCDADRVQSLDFEGGYVDDHLLDRGLLLFVGAAESFVLLFGLDSFSC